MRFKHSPLQLAALLIGSMVLMTTAQALEVNITQTISYVDTEHNGKSVRIQRIQDKTNTLSGGYTKTSRKCPPFCIQPISVSMGVTTVAELEVLDFIREKVNSSRGVLIDARTPTWFKRGTIPGSINIPFTVFGKNATDTEKGAALAVLGVKLKSGESDSSFMDYFSDLFGDYSGNTSKLDFSRAKSILLWCNGMWCGQSPAAIKGLIELGYPVDKIYYYRGGMQGWQSLGLTVVK